MSVRYVLAPQAAIDLVEIWRYIKEQSSLVIADRVETAIREKFSFLAQTPGAGHRRKDLTEADVKFFPVYSYLIVYRPETTPLQIASILHGRRDVEQILKGHLLLPHQGLSSKTLCPDESIQIVRRAPCG